MEKNLNNYPPSLQIVRKWFPVMERLAPWLAGALAKKLFFTPLRYGTPAREKEIAGKARLFNFRHRNQLLQAYEWGGDGPVVILLHGWSGRATQLCEFVEPLTAQGYKVAAFDAPAHNLSPGKYADLVFFSESLSALANHYGNVHSVIAHSMGGAATLHALQNGLKIESAVLIGTPSNPGDIITNFQHIINASEKTGKYITRYIEKTYGKPFEKFHARETGRDANLPLLVVHDEDDKEVSVRDAEALQPVLKQGRFFITRGLGHTKILRNAEVIAEAVAFINQPVLTEIKTAV